MAFHMLEGSGRASTLPNGTAVYPYRHLQEEKAMFPKVQDLMNQEELILATLIQGEHLQQLIHMKA